MAAGYKKIIELKKKLNDADGEFKKIEQFLSNIDYRLSFDPYVITIDEAAKEATFNLNPIPYEAAPQGIGTATIEQYNKTTVPIYKFKYSQGFDYKKEQEFKEYFDAFISYYVPFEEIIAIQMSSLLESVSTIQKINLGLVQTKLEAKKAFDIVEAAGDHTRELEDTGLTLLLNALKVALNVPKFMVKSVAEVTDPNIAIASGISKLYQSGVVAAEMAGIKVPVRRLPLYVTSPPLLAALIPILTPQGAGALALSYEESMFDDDSITSPNDEAC
jgi:hypothetical protein